MSKKEDLVIECGNYSVDEDYTGSKGHGLAERVIQEFGSIENYVKSKKSPEERYRDVLSEIKPKDIFDTPQQRFLLGKIFSDLRKEGCEIKNLYALNKMSDGEQWTYYNSLRRTYGLIR